MDNLPEAASPLYKKLQDYILDNIRTGKWSKNHKLPSENEFVASMGMSRMTVHRALRELSSDGFLVRVRGVGTFVAPPRPQSALIEVNNIAAEIAARGNIFRSEVLIVETVSPTRELMLSFEMTRRRELYHSVVVNFENDVAVQLEERFVNPDLFPNYHLQDFTKVTTYDFLVGMTPITEVEHVITSIPADAEVAARLGIKPGVCCLLLHRRTWTGPVIATFSKLTYVGSRYSLGSRYSPSRMG